MTITWGNLRAAVRRSVLKDSAESTWQDDDQLLDALKWSLNQFVAHTAVPSSVSWAMSTTTSTTFTLPGNLYGNPEDTALVKLKEVSSDRYRYLEPFRPVPGALWPEVTPDDYTRPFGFYVWPNDTLNLRFTPESNSTLTVEYYAYYPVPDSDDDSIAIPQWAHGAIAVLMGAYLQLTEGVAASNLGQWDVKTDSGNPEHNPLHREFEHLMGIYNDLINVHPVQQRQRWHQPGVGL